MSSLNTQIPDLTPDLGEIEIDNITDAGTHDTHDEFGVLREGVGGYNGTITEEMKEAGYTQSGRDVFDKKGRLVGEILPKIDRDQHVAGVRYYNLDAKPFSHVGNSSSDASMEPLSKTGDLYQRSSNTQSIGKYTEESIKSGVIGAAQRISALIMSIGGIYGS